MAGIARRASVAEPADLHVMFCRARNELFIHLIALIIRSSGNAPCRRWLLVCCLAVARFLRGAITADQFFAVVVRTTSSRYRRSFAEITHAFWETSRALQRRGWRASLMRDILSSPVLDCHRAFLCRHPELAPYYAG